MADTDVVIQDVVYDPEGEDVKGEHVLIANTGSDPVNMTGWTLRDTLQHRRTKPYTFQFPRFTLAGNSTVRIYTGNGTNDQDNLYWGRGWAVWNNTGDTAVLSDAAGGEISRFPYPLHRRPGQPFPNGFLWGVATAGYQVEGGSKGQDWDRFTTSQAIADRVNKNSQRVQLDVHLQHPGMAVEHRNLSVLNQDLDRAALLGINAYRFSIEWARLESRNTGTNPLRDADINQTELRYYSDVIDAIQARKMVPLVSLNHLTLPDWVLTPPEKTSILGETMEDDTFLATLRGWENEETVRCWVRFVTYVVAKFKDRVDYWITLNEPVGSMIGVGYIAGVWSPGFTLDGTRAKKAYFNLLRAHVLAYDTIKAVDDVDADGDGQTSRVGFAHAMILARDNPAQLGTDAYRQFDWFMNWHMLDAVVKGEVDENIAWRTADRKTLTGDEAADWLRIPRAPWRQRLDFVGLNYYRSAAIHWDSFILMRADFMGGAFEQNMHRSTIPHPLVNDLGWEICPAGIGHFVREIHGRYNLPVIVTENGIPETADRNRAAHLIGHLAELQAAMIEGARVDGYLHWTLVDNFEWHEHYRPEARFGLFTVDRRPPQESGGRLPRHITEGAIAYAQVIAQDGIDQMAKRFGIMTADGGRVKAPTVIPYLIYEGIVPGLGGLVLYLSLLGTGELFGLMFYAGRQRWVRLRNITWDGANQQLTFRHDANGPIPATTFDTSAIPGELKGTFSTAARSQRPWALSRNQLAGVWRIVNGGDGWLWFSRLEWDQPWQVKLLAETNAMWIPLTGIVWDADALTFKPMPGSAIGVRGTVQDSTMRVTFVPFGFTIQAQRATNDFPFG